MNIRRTIVFTLAITLIIWLCRMDIVQKETLHFTIDELVNQHYEVSTFHLKNKGEDKTFATVTLSQRGPQFLFKKTGRIWQRIIFPVERIGGKILSVGYEYPSEFIWVEIGKVSKNGFRKRLYIYSVTEDTIEETPAVFTMD